MHTVIKALEHELYKWISWGFVIMGLLRVLAEAADGMGNG